VLGETVIVRRGLELGERIAAAGSFKLREGLRVEPLDPAAAPASK
jgi:hypothetical protein